MSSQVGPLRSGVDLFIWKSTPPAPIETLVDSPDAPRIGGV